jgi:hypothetical protein
MTAIGAADAVGLPPLALVLTVAGAVMGALDAAGDPHARAAGRLP